MRALGKNPMVSELPRLIRPMMAAPRHGLPPDEDRYGWELNWTASAPSRT
jgi:hypothetical protein